MFIDSRILREARRNTYSVTNIKQNGKIICDVRNKNGEHLSFCIPTYVDKVLEMHGVMDEIKKEYKRLYEKYYK